MIFHRKITSIDGVKVGIHKREGETLYGEIVFLGGRAFDPEGKEGVSSLMGSLFYRGCGRSTYEEIVERLERMGSSLHVSVSPESVTISFWAMRKYADETLNILVNCLLEPKFPAEELKKEIERSITELKRSWDIPEAAASMIFSRKVFEPHPYSRQESEKSLRSIEVEDLIAKKDKVLKKAGTVAILSGSHENHEKALEKIISALKDGGEKPSLPEPEPGKNRTIYFHLKEDAEQTQIRIGHPSFPRKVPFYEEALVFNYILGGGGFSSRLMERVRARGGLTYSIRSSFSPMLFGGLFSISTFTKPENTAIIIEEIVDEVQNTIDNGVNEEEVEKAKGYYLGHFPLGLETPSQIGSLLSGMLYYSLGEDYPEKFLKKIREVTAGGINEISKELINPDCFTIVAVGNKRAEQELGKIGKILYVEPE